MRIGSIPGVIYTEAGWLGGHEVTLTYYDESVINAKKLTAAAKKARIANKVYDEGALGSYRAARESDQKRQLKGTIFEKIPDLTDYQKTKLNSYVRSEVREALRYLSPRQVRYLKEQKK